MLFQNHTHAEQHSRRQNKNSNSVGHDQKLNIISHNIHAVALSRFHPVNQAAKQPFAAAPSSSSTERTFYDAFEDIGEPCLGIDVVHSAVPMSVCMIAVLSNDPLRAATEQVVMMLTHDMPPLQNKATAPLSHGDVAVISIVIRSR